MSIAVFDDEPEKSGSTGDKKPTSLVKIINHTPKPEPVECSKQPIRWMGKMEREKK